MIIDELYSVLPRPAVPVECGTDAEWLDVFERLGIRPPQDYIEFIQSYGTGTINDWITVFNPFAKSKNFNLLRQVPTLLSSLRELRMEFPDSYTIPLFFEPGGVLPWGLSIDGDIFCWVTRGLPGRWTTLVLCRHSDAEFVPVSMTQYLARAISGTISSHAMPKAEIHIARFIPYVAE